MKWQNKGFEFEELGKRFQESSKLIFIGEDFDQAHYYVNKPIEKLLDFLDVDIEFIKFPKKFMRLGLVTKLLLLFYIKKYKLKDEKAVIIPHCHYSEICCINKLTKYLKRFLPQSLIYHTNDFFEKYLSVYSAYTQNKTYLRDTCIIVTTICTLNCKYCLNFTPFIQNPAAISLDKLKEEASIYFKSIDKVSFFQISGGEPLSYKELPEYIEWLAENYNNQIGQILLATNGTLIPNEKLTDVLKRHKIILLLDNYTDAVPRTKQTRDKLIKHLNENGIDYRNYESGQKFFKFFPANEDYSLWSEEDLISRADKCWGLQPCRNLRNGRIYYCNFSSFAVTAGIIQDDPVNYYDLNNPNLVNKKELMEFALGYSELGYDTFCKLCNGINSANTLTRDIAGRQASGKIKWHEGMTLKEYDKM